jgi:serine-type D-Ala-D-Ala carboxypeptidase
MARFQRALQVIEDAVRRRVTPCAAFEVGGPDGVDWCGASGRLWYGANAPEATSSTIFDLASLTKVLATSTLAVRLVESGRLDLSAPVERAIPAWRGPGRERVTVEHLLAHASGLPAVRPYHATLSGRAAFQSAICREPLESSPGTASVYSDLGFILLGFVLEDAVGATLDVQFDGLVADVSRSAAARGRFVPGGPAPEIRFRPPAEWFDRAAPTRADPRLGRPRRGEVDDDNAAALGGVAGHAGLFGTAGAVGSLAREWLGGWLGRDGFEALGGPEALQRFTRGATIAAGSRALGWDTMLTTSSCGVRMSTSAFGHTGFTGTSLWIDPAVAVYAVLLTNRVYPDAGPGDAIAALRRDFHDAVLEERADDGAGRAPY